MEHLGLSPKEHLGMVDLRKKNARGKTANGDGVFYALALP